MNPFRYRYWLVINTWDRLHIIRERFKRKIPKHYTLVDGPFDTQEDTVRALHFWAEQKINTRVRP